MIELVAESLFRINSCEAVFGVKEFVYLLKMNAGYDSFLFNAVTGDSGSTIVDSGNWYTFSSP